MKKNNEKNKVGSVAFALTLSAVIGVIFLMLGGIGARMTSFNPAVLSGILSVIYVIICFVIVLILRRIREKGNGDAVIRSVLSTVLRDTVGGMDSPVIICGDKDDIIIWSNACAVSLVGADNSILGVEFKKYAGVTSQDVFADENGIGTEAVIGGKSMRIKGQNIRANDRHFFVFTMTDVSEIKALSADIEQKELAVAYIVVDNLEEIRRYEQDRFRECSSQVASILSNWAKEMSGVIKEYERDKYLLVFTRGQLDAQVAKRFDVLDKIRDIHVGGGAIPITVSIGISSFGKTFAEKEKSSLAALEMALQRGGDQVVVRNKGETDIYGGRTRSYQKRDTVRARVISGELINYISRASNVIIMGHRFADFDCFGAAVGISRLAMLVGVPVNIVTDFGDSSLNECRNSLADVKEYKDVFVGTEEALDLVTTKTLLVIVDVNNKALFESKELVSVCADYVVIDHHRMIEEFEREPLITYIEPSAAATCELVSEMLEQTFPSEIMISKEANLMMAGILLDTKQFSVNTTSRTFSAALFLRDRGANPAEAMKFFSQSLDDYIREAKFRSNVTAYRDIIAISVGDGEGENADRVAAAKSADKLLSVEGVRASFALIKIGGIVHISARSSGDINVQLILEQLRGGGHFDAAGAQVETASVEEALILLKKAIDSYLDDRIVK